MGLFRVLGIYLLQARVLINPLLGMKSSTHMGGVAGILEFLVYTQITQSILERRQATPQSDRLFRPPAVQQIQRLSGIQSTPLEWQVYLPLYRGFGDLREKIFGHGLYKGFLFTSIYTILERNGSLENPLSIETPTQREVPHLRSTPTIDIPTKQLL